MEIQYNDLGICPACYKFVTDDQDSLMLENGDRKVIYHAACLTQQAPDNNPVTREEWMTLHMDEWQAMGMTAKQMREHLQCSLSHVSKELGISVARLKRFEAGEPVRDAKLLQKAYLLWITGENTYRQYNLLHRHIYGFDYFPGMKKDTVIETLIHAWKETDDELTKN